MITDEQAVKLIQDILKVLQPIKDMEQAILGEIENTEC